MPAAYYNEIDPYAAAWLRNLIAAGHIAPGDVDERSIEDVCPDDLRPYAQCHWFAGVGVWSAALRGVGWPDDRRIWTGSCPCQPFSAAGAGAGFADERHLWPAWFHLITQCEPSIVVGEQVASKAVDPWIDLVQADMEAVGYAFGAVAFPSAGVGAPHIRDRTYFVADADRGGRGERTQCRGNTSQPEQQTPWGNDPSGCGRLGGLADALYDGQRQYGHGLGRAPGEDQGSGHQRERLRADPADGVAVGGLDDAAGPRHAWQVEGAEGNPWDEARLRLLGSGRGQDRDGRPGPTNGFWRDPDWLFCRDGKWRPVEPGTSPLAHGAPARVGRLRAYGNAINLKAAEEFLTAALLGPTT